MEQNRVGVISDILGKNCETLYKNIKKAVGYKGRSFRVEHFEPMPITSYWDNGSRDYWYYVDLRDYSAQQVVQNGTPFDGLNLRAERLDYNQVLVNVAIINGKARSCVVFC